MLQWHVREMRRPRHKQIRSVKGSWITAIGAGGLLPKISSKAFLSPNEICMELYEGASQPTSLRESLPLLPAFRSQVRRCALLSPCACFMISQSHFPLRCLASLSLWMALGRRSY